ncbi:MAG: hypothetical protein U5O16_03195, partial [Rhodococcus sp. (in: high G+C Gram-positive bacteria)]|uniref:hypothetical protein n=1 Tax=Rhodococcus sp. TaxID=1831 RepID=UPI002AD91E2D|nr:hypothetical protein [Rhodococcus sp. (in: high G+C Gram-positive bacteria)]
SLASRQWTLARRRRMQSAIHAHLGIGEWHFAALRRAQGPIGRDGSGGVQTRRSVTALPEYDTSFLGFGRYGRRVQEVRRLTYFAFS